MWAEPPEDGVVILHLRRSSWVCVKLRQRMCFWKEQKQPGSLSSGSRAVLRCRPNIAVRRGWE